MNKKFTKLMAALALLTFLAVPMGMWGQTRADQTVIWAATSGGLGSGIGSGTITDNGGYSWSYTRTLISGTSYTGWTNNCIQLGKNGGVENLTLTTSAIPGIIKSVAVECSSYNAAHKVSITVGEVTYLASTATSSWTTVGTATGTGTSSGTITIAFTDGTRALYIKSITVVYDNSGGPITYAVTYNGNGNTSGAVPTDNNAYENGDNVTVLGNTGNLAKTGHTFSGWCLNEGGTGTVYGPGTGQTATYTISANTTFYAKWTLNTHNITMPIADAYGSYSASATSNVPYGTNVTLTYAPATGYENYLATWSVNGTTISGNSFPMPDEDVTVTVTCENVVVDELSGAQVYGAMQNSSSKTYKEWELTTTNGTTFVGNTNDSQDYIQMNTGSNRGIVSTVSIGKAKKVDVIFVNNTTNGRKITVYGKNTPYEGPSDLYDDDNKGTELGEIICGTNTEISISGDYMYIGLLASGALYVEPITITWEPVTTYEVVYQGSYTMSNVEIGTVEVSSANAIEGAEVTITATGHNHYHFSGWTVIDENESPIDLTGTNPATFIMPGSDVYVDATFAEDTKYTVSIDVDSEDYVLVDPELTYAGESVQIQITGIPSGKALDEVTVTKENQTTVAVTYEGEEDEYSIYSFFMPEDNVTVSVSFRDLANYSVSYFVLGVLDQTAVVTEGQSTLLPTTVNTELGDYTLLGWMDEVGTTVESPYTPEGDVSLYAILGSMSTTTLTINKDTENFPNSYGSANTFTEYTLEGKKFKIQQGYVNGTKLQWRAAGNSSGTGTMYNSENFGRITSIVLVYDASDNNKNFTIKAGISENPTEGTEIAPSISNNSYSFDLSDAEYTYFVMTNGSGAGYLTTITIYYEEIAPATIVTVYDEEVERSEDIENLEYVIVKAGGVLNFTGFNYGTSANLIIEDGGQLFASSQVAATVQKNIVAHGATPADGGWNFIASPVAQNLTSNVLTGSGADLYYYEEASHMWRNYKINDNLDGFDFANGKGYLYANSANTTLSFAGLQRPSNESVTVPADNLSCAADVLTGFNLVGNPFPCKATLNRDYYAVNGSGLDAKTAEVVLDPCAGAMVQVSAENKVVTFTRVEPTTQQTSQPNQLQMTVAQQVMSRGTATSMVNDNAIVNFNAGSRLEKFAFNADAAKLYIPQNGKDYAIVSAEAQGEMPVNFRAANDGQYTLTVNPEGVEMNYLHLIDNMTGMDIDLLQTPTYTFNATTRDYESRFRLVFAANNENGVSAGSTTFAYFSNGSLVVNNEGNATLQVVDVMGRIVKSESINGSASINVNAAPGVYTLRLVNGNDVKTQKVVVR
jgi:hypothetical protein